MCKSITGSDKNYVKKKILLIQKIICCIWYLNKFSFQWCIIYITLITHKAVKKAAIRRYFLMSNTNHPIAANPLIKSCFDEIDKLFPEAKVNTVLLNYYPDGDATIPFHSDNEPEICRDSFIFTYSIGQTRTLVFRDIDSKKHLCNISLHHNSLIFFTKASQFLYEHSITSQTLDCTHDKRRISLTFRKINWPFNQWESQD